VLKRLKDEIAKNESMNTNNKYGKDKNKYLSNQLENKTDLKNKIFDNKFETLSNEAKNNIHIKLSPARPNVKFETESTQGTIHMLKKYKYENEKKLNPQNSFKTNNPISSTLTSTNNSSLLNLINNSNNDNYNNPKLNSPYNNKNPKVNNIISKIISENQDKFNDFKQESKYKNNFLEQNKNDEFSSFNIKRVNEKDFDQFDNLKQSKFSNKDNFKLGEFESRRRNNKFQEIAGKDEFNIFQNNYKPNLILNRDNFKMNDSSYFKGY